jgi:hypothetical protein
MVRVHGALQDPRSPARPEQQRFVIASILGEAEESACQQLATRARRADAEHRKGAREPSEHLGISSELLGKILMRKGWPSEPVLG